MAGRHAPPPFTKRRRPEPEPAPLKGRVVEEAPRPKAEHVEDDADAWEPISGEEMADTLSGLFDSLEEGFGPEWKLDDARAKKMGARQARVLNRFGKRARSLFVLRLLVYFTLFFAVVELVAIIAGRTIRTMRRRRAEAAEEAKKRKAQADAARSAPGSNVVPIGGEAAGGGGG